MYEGEEFYKYVISYSLLLPWSKECSSSLRWTQRRWSATSQSCAAVARLLQLCNKDIRQAFSNLGAVEPSTDVCNQSQSQPKGFFSSDDKLCSPPLLSVGYKKLYIMAYNSLTVRVRFEVMPSQFVTEEHKSCNNKIITNCFSNKQWNSSE